MGGEKYKVHVYNTVDKGSPPHGRGKVRSVPLRPRAIRITPAWAGKRGWMRATEITRKDHPRMGGEKNSSISWEKWKTGSPPHGRGKAHELRTLPRAIRITPAWAGKRRVLYFSHDFTWDHPRMGGEKLARFSQLSGKQGSPPHGRGKASTHSTIASWTGITPAWAGKSLISDVPCFV